jgi:hypothetical protein
MRGGNVQLPVVHTSSVHGFESVQPAPPMQAPAALHWSPNVQTFPSSHAFSACTAIVARKESKTFMAHILGSNTDDLNKTLDAARSLGYSEDRTRLFSPFWTEPDGTTMDSWNHRLEKIADERALQIDFFPYIGYSVHNPDDIRHTTILVGRDALWSVGTDFKTTYKKTPRGEVAQLRTVIRGLTYRDYE